MKVGAQDGLPFSETRKVVGGARSEENTWSSGWHALPLSVEKRKGHVAFRGVD